SVTASSSLHRKSLGKSKILDPLSILRVNGAIATRGLLRRSPALIPATVSHWTTVCIFTDAELHGLRLCARRHASHHNQYCTWRQKARKSPCHLFLPLEILLARREQKKNSNLPSAIAIWQEL